VISGAYASTRGGADRRALAGLFLLLRREDGLAAKFDPLGLGVGPAPRRTLQGPAALQLCGNSENRKEDIGKERVVPW
jgi:hypothetical protein